MKFKTHIAVLSSYVLFNMQAFALVSGSPFASSGAASQVGQYAGVLVPLSSTSTYPYAAATTDATTKTVVDTEKNTETTETTFTTTNFIAYTTSTSDATEGSFNALGVFTINVPRTGFSSGTFRIFIGGLPLVGTIQAVANPNKSTISGVLSGEASVETSSSSNSATGSSSSSSAIAALGSGGILAKTSKIKGSKKSSSRGQILLLSGSANVALTDYSSIITVTNNGRTSTSNPAVTNAVFTVDGYQQSVVAASN